MRWVVKPTSLKPLWIQTPITFSPLKANQGQLYEDVRLLFDGVSTGELRDVEVDLNQTIDGNHGRIETRTDKASE